MMDSGQYVWPVLEFDEQSRAMTFKSYCGSCFFVGPERLMVTCRHVLEGYHSIFVQAPDYTQHRVIDPWYHPHLDLAIATVPGVPSMVMQPLGQALLLGADVSAFAYIRDSLNGKPAILPTMAKGYVTRLPATAGEMEGGLGRFAVSFSSLKGFSGAPVTLFDSNQFVGMLYGNIQEQIEVHTKTVTDDNGEIWNERLVRMVEQGVMIGFGEVMKAVDAYRTTRE